MAEGKLDRCERGSLAKCTTEGSRSTTAAIPLARDSVAGQADRVIDIGNRPVVELETAEGGTQVAECRRSQRKHRKPQRLVEEAS